MLMEVLELMVVPQAELVPLAVTQAVMAEIMVALLVLGEPQDESRK